MADQKQATQATQATEAVSPGTGKRFIDMEGAEKITFLGKVVVMLVSGGFAFPNIFVE